MRVSRRLWPIFYNIDALNFFPLRHFALACTFISDFDSSTSDESSNERRYSFSRRWYSKNEMIVRVSSVLKDRGWDWNLPSRSNFLFDESLVSKIMNELYAGTSDAALAFFFFRWSQRHNGVNHHSHAVCTMIHISVMGNMNHVAMKLLRDLIRCRRGISFPGSLFNLLKETSDDGKTLETVYSMLLGCHLEDDMLDDAVQLMDAMKTLGFFPATGVCITLIKRLLRSEKLELTFLVFSEALRYGRDLSNHCISLLINYCSVRGNFSDALELFAQMFKNGCKPDIVCYTIIINSLCKKGYLKEATFLLLKLIQEGLSSDSILTSSVVEGYCKAGRLSEAMGILRVLDFAPDEFIYNSFIRKLCDDGKIRNAAKLLEEMPERGAFPDAFNWTTVFSGHCKANEIKEGLKVLGGMLKRGIKLSLPTYTVLIDCYCRMGQMQDAESLICLMGKNGLKPDLAAHNVLIRGYSMKGQMREAFKVLDAMKDCGIRPDLVTYNTLIHGFAKRGNVEEAGEVLGELSVSGHSPDQFTYTILMNGFMKAGNIQEAYKIWSHLSRSGGRPDFTSYSVIISGLCRGRRVQEGYALFVKMVEDGLSPDLELYNALVCGFCWQGHVVEAFDLVNLMAENGVIPNQITYRALSQGLKRKNVRDFEEVAAAAIQRILAENNIFVDSSVCVTR